jgi:hypothetical protein
MASITTRETGTTGTGGVTRKNLPLTNAEIDTNFINLNTDKLEGTGSTSLVTVGTITTGTWSATAIATNKGGTGLTSFTSGGAVYASSTSALTTGTLPTASGGTGLTTFTAANNAIYSTSASALTAGTLPVAAGGTGQTTYTNGQLLIGNTTGNTLTNATLSGTTNQVTVTNGTGTITLATPQDLATSSNIQFGSLGIGTAASGTAGEIRATNNITAFYTSDRKFKENIQDIPNALDKAIKIGGKLFDWTNEYIEEHGGEDGYFMQKSDFGVIAQDVESVFPVAIRKKPDGSLAVDYEKLCALAFAAIRELNEEIKKLKGE